MADPKRILFISQEIFPYLPDETPIRMLNRKLPEYFQSHGYETRTFMPKFGDINERRNQLHEVIRLSGMNMIISDSDHPLLIKVASIQSARIQIYFIDNDDFFGRRKGTARDEQGNECADNDERCIFFARGVLETVKKLRWTPDIIYCSGWFSALVPLYIKKAYADTPFFTQSKVITALDDMDYKTPFSTKFSEKLMMDGLTQNDIRNIVGFPVGYEELMRLAVDYSDAFIQSAAEINPRVSNYMQTSGKPILPFEQSLDPEQLMTFCNRLIDHAEED